MSVTATATRAATETIIAALESYGFPRPVTEYRFHPDRLWRFDFAWPQARDALREETCRTGVESRGSGDQDQKSSMRGKTMICTECLIRGKDWEGSDPKCAFDNDEKLFSTDNWNCATMNKLRERVDYHVNDDLNAASISVVHIPEAVAASDVEPGQGYIVMTFYKERGRTGQAWVMFDDQPPKPLTLELAEAVVRYYAPKEEAA